MLASAAAASALHSRFLGTGINATLATLKADTAWAAAARSLTPARAVACDVRADDDPDDDVLSEPKPNDDDELRVAEAPSLLPTNENGSSSCAAAMKASVMTCQWRQASAQIAANRPPCWPAAGASGAQPRAPSRASWSVHYLDLKGCVTNARRLGSVRLTAASVLLEVKPHKGRRQTRTRTSGTIIRSAEASSLDHYAVRRASSREAADSSLARRARAAAAVRCAGCVRPG